MKNIHPDRLRECREEGRISPVEEAAIILRQRGLTPRGVAVQLGLGTGRDGARRVKLVTARGRRTFLAWAMARGRCRRPQPFASPQVIDWSSSRFAMRTTTRAAISGVAPRPYMTRPSASATLQVWIAPAVPAPVDVQLIPQPRTSRRRSAMAISAEISCSLDGVVKDAAGSGASPRR